MKHKKYDFRTAFIDLLINVLTGIVFLFMITTLLIQNKTKEDPGVKKDAQYVINISWNSDINCDVDLWVQDPRNRVVSYQSKDVGVMNLERDDQGWTNDVVIMQNNDQTIQQLDNSETWVLRGKMAGKFTVNLHLYSCTIEGRPLQLGEVIDIPVKVELVRLNPDLKKKVEGTYTLHQVWEEITIFNFVLDGNNEVVDMTYEQVDLVKEKQQQ